MIKDNNYRNKTGFVIIASEISPIKYNCSILVHLASWSTASMDRGREIDPCSWNLWNSIFFYLI